MVTVHFSVPWGAEWEFVYDMIPVDLGFVRLPFQPPTIKAH